MTNSESESWPGATCSGWSKRNSIHSLSKISWEEEKINLTVEMKRRKSQSKPHYQLVTILGLLVKTGLGIGGQVWVAHDPPQVREKASVGFEGISI